MRLTPSRFEPTHAGYDEKTLFKNTNLQIDRGERVAMIGPNGCGKSTLMRLMQGKEEPNAGLAGLAGPHTITVNIWRFKSLSLKLIFFD